MALPPMKKALEAARRFGPAVLALAGALPALSSLFRRAKRGVATSSQEEARKIGGDIRKENEAASKRVDSKLDDAARR